jgi:hypothetical protein
MSATGSLPSLSQIENLDTGHLSQLATDFIAEADLVENSFTEAHERLRAARWEGQANDAALYRTDTDQVTARGHAEVLREAADIARFGSEGMRAAQQSVLKAVGEARCTGFVVNDDLSVTDGTTSKTLEEYIARQERAQDLAADIHERAATLAATDRSIAAKLSAVIAKLGKPKFTESAAPGGPGTPPMDDHVHAVDQHTFKEGPPPAPPPVNPFTGWTDEQMRQVATEIAHGHAWDLHKGDFPKGWTERDLARWIYDTMNDPSTRIGTSTESGGAALFRDGKVIFIDPRGPDYGTAFAPKPSSGGTWRTPEQYFEQHTRALEPLPPPAPGRLPPVAPGEMAPPGAAPSPEPAPAPRNAPPPPVKSPAPIDPPALRPGPSVGGSGGGGGWIPGVGIGAPHIPTEEVD